MILNKVSVIGGVALAIENAPRFSKMLDDDWRFVNYENKILSAISLFDIPVEWDEIAEILSSAILRVLLAAVERAAADKIIDEYQRPNSHYFEIAPLWSLGIPADVLERVFCDVESYLKKNWSKHYFGHQRITPEVIRALAIPPGDGHKSGTQLPGVVVAEDDENLLSPFAARNAAVLHGKKAVEIILRLMDKMRRKIDQECCGYVSVRSVFPDKGTSAECLIATIIDILGKEKFASLVEDDNYFAMYAVWPHIGWATRDRHQKIWKYKIDLDNDDAEFSRWWYPYMLRYWIMTDPMTPPDENMIIDGVRKNAAKSVDKVKIPNPYLASSENDWTIPWYMEYRKSLSSSSHLPWFRRYFRSEDTLMTAQITARTVYNSMDIDDAAKSHEMRVALCELPIVGKNWITEFFYRDNCALVRKMFDADPILAARVVENAMLPWPLMARKCEVVNLAYATVNQYIRGLYEHQ